jgi:hypothetical protein
MFFSYGERSSFITTENKTENYKFVQNYREKLRKSKTYLLNLRSYSGDNSLRNVKLCNLKLSISNC